MSASKHKKRVHKKKSGKSTKKGVTKEDAEKIQANWRGYKSRHQYNEQRKAVVWL